MVSHGPSLPFGVIAGASWGTITALATSQAADLTRMNSDLRVPVILFLAGIASPALICWRLAPSADQLGDVARRGVGPLTPVFRWRFYAVVAAALYTAAFLLDAVALHTRAGLTEVLNLTSAGAVTLAATCAVIWALGPRLAAESEGTRLRTRLPFSAITAIGWAMVVLFIANEGVSQVPMRPGMRVAVVVFLAGIAGPALICWRLSPSADDLGIATRLGVQAGMAGAGAHVRPLAPVLRWRFYAVAAAALYTAAFLLDAIALHTRAGLADVLNLTSVGAVMLAAACAVIWALGPRLAAGSEGFRLGLDGAQALREQFGLECTEAPSSLHPSLPPTLADEFRF